MFSCTVILSEYRKKNENENVKENENQKQKREQKQNVRIARACNAIRYPLLIEQREKKDKTKGGNDGY